MEWLAVSPLPQTSRCMLWDGTSYAHSEIRDTFVKAVRAIFVDRQNGSFQGVTDAVGPDGALDVTVNWLNAAGAAQSNSLSVPVGSYYVTGVSVYGETLTAGQLLGRYRVDGVVPTEH